MWRLAYAAGLALLVFYLLITHALRWYNSDDVAVQTILGQWLRGYHETTHFGADSFVLKLPLYLIVRSVFDNSRGTILLTALVINVTGFALFATSVRYFATRFLKDRSHLVIWPLLWVAGLGLILANSLITPNLRNVEIGLAFFLAMLVAKCWDGEVAWSPAWILIAVPLIGLFLYDDPYFLFLWVVPLIGLLLVSAVIRWFDRRAAILAGVLAAGVVAYKAIDLAFRAFGFRAKEPGTSLADLDGIRRHLRLLLHGGLRLFEADLISNPLTLADPRPLFNIAVLLLALLYPVGLWRRRVHLRDEPWRWFFGLQPLLVAAVFVFSNQALDLASARYLILIPFLLVLVIGTGLNEIASERIRNGAIVLVATATVVNLLVTADYYGEQPKGANRLNVLVVDAARRSGLTKGYAGYWSSNINTYLSDERVDFIQVACWGPQAEPYDWLVDDGILAKPASRTFYLWEDDDLRSGCAYGELIRQFGEPAEVLPVTNEKKLLVYEYDLAGRM